MLGSNNSDGKRNGQSRSDGKRREEEGDDEEKGVEMMAV